MNKRRKKLPVILEVEEVQKILNIPNKRYLTGLRNKVILNLMWNMGLRVSEVVNLRPGDVNITNRKLRILNGKGGVDRDITIPEGLIYLLKEWKDRRPVSDYFICNIKTRQANYDIETRNGRVLKPTSRKGDKISIRTIQIMLRDYSKRAGIDYKKVTPHILRHSFATEWIRQNKSIVVLKEILGHSDISTTQIYVTLATKDIEEAMNGYEIKAI